MKFAKRVFLIAGIWGLLVLLPMYFLEAKNGRDFPPPINHPEFYYGFVGVALAWQVLFLILSKAPSRYRPMMIPAVLEKLTFSLAVFWLYAQHKVAVPILGAAIIDFSFGVLFVAAYFKTSDND
ncbi:MAG: hypothetical protein ABI977_35595 [Acidobacteriota bacterium]